MNQPARPITALPQLEANPLQRALDNYQELERQLSQTTAENTELRIDNGGLVSEVEMLRDLLKTTEADRVRWQAIASTLLGRLYAINDTVTGAVRAAIKDGFEAKEPDERKEDLEKAGAEVAAILQRVEPAAAPEAPPAPQSAPEPPKAAEGAIIPKVDFGAQREAVGYRR